MPHEIRSITQVGTSEPFELQVSRGQITAHYKVHKFGFNNLIQNSEETVWTNGGIYAYATSGENLLVSSTAGASDSGVEITLQGLDEDYNQIEEVFTLGSGTYTTTKSFFRSYRAFVSGSKAASGTVNFRGGGAVVRAQILAGDQQTLMCVWTVPSGYTAYLLQNNVTCYTEANNKFGIVRLVSKQPGGVFRTNDKHTVVNSQNAVEYPVPVSFPEKTDIEMRAVGSSSNANLQVSASLDIVYIKNEEGV